MSAKPPRAEAVAAAVHAAVLEGGMAEAVIGCPLLRVLQHLVGFVDFLELVLAGVIAGVAIRMELHGELAERGLELLFVGALLHAQRFVEISFHVAPSYRSAVMDNDRGPARWPKPGAWYVFASI